MLSLANLNIEKQATKSAKKSKSSIKDTITKRLRKVCEETLRKEFSQYFVDLDDTTVFKHHMTSNEINDKYDVNGEHVIIPKDDVKLSYKGEIVKLDKSFRVGKLQVFIDGIFTQTSEYVKIDGKKVTTLIKKK